MSFASSAIARRLSNWRGSFLNNCAIFARATLPQDCLLCAAPAHPHALCAECYAQLPWLPPLRCPQCAMPTSTGNLCGGCLAHPPRFDAVTAAFVYAWPLAPLIHHYKYAGNLALAQLLGQALAARANRTVDYIIPMPLSPARLTEPRRTRRYAGTEMSRTRP